MGEIDPLEDCIKDNEDLFSLGWYLYWKKGDTEATLDGTFSAIELRAIADYMDKNNKNG